MNKLDLRQTILHAALSMVGSAASATTDTILPLIDAELAKLFEDRNIILADGGTITFTGTQIQFTEALNLVITEHVAGGPVTKISLGSSNQNLNNNDMFVAVINRSSGTATTSVVAGATGLAAITSTNQETFLIATRIDAADGTQRLYWRNGTSLNAGQTTRLGQGGSGSGGSGTGDDLDALQFRASFADAFAENISNANSSLNSSGTNAVFNAAKSMYTMSYDASKTVTGSGTAMTMSSAPAFTVAVGDILVQGGEARKITVVTSQTAYTIESAFTIVPAPSAAAATVSQAVYTKDIYNFAADGAAISAGFPASTFSEILVDYKDNATTGSNLFTPDVAPVVAYTATNDNTNFTQVKKRATNVTDLFSTTILPSAGSNLYLRFFANESSGSGTVNLITYKAFMQKNATTAASNQILWSAAGTTNSSTTANNCAVSVVGGKTVISGLPQYPVGGNPSGTVGALMVTVNGQVLPRFLSGTTPTDQAYYTEFSSTSIQLDTDYSGHAYDFQVAYVTSFTDSAAPNTGAIAAQKEIDSIGFQAFAATNLFMNPTSAAGAPAAGTFYSTISNRAPIIDKNQDLKVRFGIDRTQLTSLFLIPSERAPSGLPVWGIPGDTDGNIRLVGTAWQSTEFAQAGFSNANTIYSSTIGDYMEVTFFGTHLNLLVAYNSNSFNYDMRASVDGGAEGSNIFTANASASLNFRGYPANQVIPVASGLSSGVHTAKIRVNANNANISITGVEAINSSSSLLVQPGVSYTAGAKAASTSQQSLAYNASVTGTRGGRTIVYQNADGTVGSAFNPAGSLLTSTSTNHSNEEIAHTYIPLEFGANRGDDFSSANAGGTYGYTLGDGTTTLGGSAIQYIVNNSAIGAGVVFNSDGANLILQFVGTGLDITLYDTGAGGSDNYTFSIDGASQIAFPYTSGVQAMRTIQLCSGLPYGSHCIRIRRITAATYTPVIMSLSVYQPKKPAIPAGAFELADYCNLAPYVANTTMGLDTIATGVIRKGATHEFAYIGSGWSVVGPNNTSYNGVFLAATNGNGDYLEYTFFGTGFEIRSQNFNTNSSSVSLLVDGAIPTGTTSSVYGWSYNSGTGVIDQTPGSLNAPGAGLSISGLSLGVHKIRLTNNTTGQFTIDDIDVIMPTYGAKIASMPLQNEMVIGSANVLDTRALTPVRDSNLQKKNSAQGIGRSSTPSTTSTSPIPYPDVSTVITVKTGKSLRISYSTSQYISGGSGGASMFQQVYVDGIAVGKIKQVACSSVGQPVIISDTFKVPVSPGVHVVQLYWYVTGSTWSCPADYRNILVEEVD
jgi:hypothetical protein